MAYNMKPDKQKTELLSETNIKHQESFTRLEKFAIWITSHIGTMGFFLIILSWTVIWLSWNLFAPAKLRFDPFPAFAFWLFISNMIQILLMPLILIGQNLLSRHAGLRAEEEFKTNIEAKKEIENVSVQIKKQNELISKLLERLEK
jgi:uncharacterized membrane protein